MTPERLAEIRAAYDKGWPEPMRPYVVELLAEIDALTRQARTWMETYERTSEKLSQAQAENARLAAELAEVEQEHSTCDTARTLHSDRIQSTFAEQDRQIELLTADVVKLREALLAVDRAVNAWVGCEAPRVETTGPYWNQMERARAHGRNVLAETAPE